MTGFTRLCLTVASAQPVLESARRVRPPLRVLGLGSYRLAVLLIVLLIVIIACIVAWRRR